MREYALDKAIPYRNTFADYLVLMKPGIVGLVIVSTLTGMYIGGHAHVELPLVLWTLVGVGLATAGSAVLNNYIDRDIDQLMERTSARALAAGTIPPALALVLGGALILVSAVILSTMVNPLTAGLTMVAVFIYVVVYGMVLKRRSSFANQAGGIAGALPPLLGYTAATGGVNIEALLLFAVVAIWQQPHALSLALKYREQYRRAGIPVVPVVRGVRTTKLRILLYTVALLLISVLPWQMGMAGVVYLVTALVAGTIFVLLALKFFSSRRDRNMFLFFYSIVYLTAIFLAMVVDIRI